MAEYLTVLDVSRLLQVNPATIRKWAADGRLPALRLPGGDEWRFDEEQVRAAMELPVTSNED